MALLSDKQQRDLLIALGLADFATRSRLSTAAFDVIVATARGVGPAAARGTAGFVPAAARTVGMVAMKHPYVAGAAVLYVGIKNREKIRSLLEEGYDIIEEPVVQPVSQFLQEQVFTPEAAVRARQVGTIQQPTFIKKITRGPSKFNKAVRAGMKAIKTSTSYGGKGKIKPAKKAFSVVVKLASAKKKKKKAPKSGIRRRIWNAMKGLR